MLDTRATSDYATDLRNALDVLEEDSHLGLDDAFANKLREVLLRRISQTEATLSCRPADPVRFAAERENTPPNASVSHDMA